MPEWLMGADCKSAGYTYVGSNPTRPKLLINSNFCFKVRNLFFYKIYFIKSHFYKCFGIFEKNSLLK